MREAIPNWPNGVVVFRDELDARLRRGHSPKSLTQRAEMLRVTTRPKDDNIYVTSLAVLAWSVGDLMECLTLAVGRRTSVHVLDTGLVIPPSPAAAVLYEATKAFEVGRKADLAQRAGERGGIVSAQRRVETAKAGAESIRPYWGLSSVEYPTLELLERAGISRNTAKQYLGSRKAAQTIHGATEKRKALPYSKRGKFTG